MCACVRERERERERERQRERMYIMLQLKTMWYKHKFFIHIAVKFQPYYQCLLLMLMCITVADIILYSQQLS